MAEGAEGSDAGDKTEAASQRRLDKAREDGQVAVSRELAGLGALVGGVLGLMIALAPGRSMMQGLGNAMARSHEIQPLDAAVAMMRLGMMVALPVALLTALGAVGATLLQTRGLVSAKGLAPRLSRLNPAAALKRIFGLDGLVEFLRTVLKLTLVGAALWHAIGDPAELPRLVHLPPAALLARLGEAAWDLAVAALMAFAAIAAADWLFQRQRHLHRMRMSRHDQKEEARESEGDPHIKARQRQIRHQRARGRMMAAVPKAAVVITNPTHFAVALAYDQDGESAPRIVAKGADEIAARIRAVAGDSGVPIVSNPPLARALFRLELDTEIPSEHYQAVAEIIAYVWRLGGRGQAG